jgi:hypothetical protein
MTTREERRRSAIEARRARRRPKRKTNRRGLLVSVGAAVLVLAAAAGVDRWRGANDKPGEVHLVAPKRDGSKVVAGAAPVEIVRAPASFRVVYRLEEEGKKGVSYTTDKVAVRRPWESRLDTLAGKPPGGKVLSFQAARFGKRITGITGQDASSLDLPPAVPPSDVRLLPVLQAGLDGGELVRREVREVLGRRCQVYRSAQYLSAVVLKPPTDKEYADTCVDEAGIVLEEVLVTQGDIVARRVAVEIEEDALLSDDLFPDLPSSVPPASGGGVLRKLKAGSMPPGDFFVLDAPPPGFELLGRYTVIPPQADNFSDPTREGARRAGTSDVWVRGVDVLIVDQGGTLRGDPPFTVDETNPKVDLGQLGQGERLLSAVTNEVRVILPSGRYLRVAGTLSPDDLAAVARSLHSVPGGTLEYE